MIYDFEFIGKMPLLMHHDNIEGSDTVKAWFATEEGKKLSKAGDDRTPAWTWMTYLYTDGDVVTIPCDNIMAALRFGGSKVTLKGPATFKGLTQSGIVMMEEHYPLLVGGQSIPIAKINAFRERPFPDHLHEARKLGFDLFMKRATIGKGQSATKHVRVRPRFDEWSVRGQLQVIDPVITTEVLTAIVDATGRMAGLGDWRPGCRSGKIPGPYGTFEAKVKRAK